MLVAGCGITPSPARPVVLRQRSRSVSDWRPAGARRRHSLDRSQHRVRRFGRFPPRRPTRTAALLNSGRRRPTADRFALKIRRGRFHDGEPITASIVRDILVRELPAYMGPAFGDVQAIQVVADDELEFTLKQPLDVSHRKPRPGDYQRPASRRSEAGLSIRRGRSMADEVEMLAHEGHYAGKPADRSHRAQELHVGSLRVGRHASRAGRHALRRRHRSKGLARVLDPRQGFRRFSGRMPTRSS